MNEGTKDIQEHIESERTALGRKIGEMESRVKNMTDPKAFFNKHTGCVLGAAVAGGFLLAVAVGKAPASPLQNFQGGDRTEAPGFGAAKLHKVVETLDTIADGLVDVVSEKVTSFVADAVPGFQRQYDERKRARST